MTAVRPVERLLPRAAIGPQDRTGPVAGDPEHVRVARSAVAEEGPR
jgi:hypothetical protein